MSKFPLIPLSAGVGLLLFCADASGANQPDDAVRLRKLEQAVEQLQKENAALKEQIHHEITPDVALPPASKIKLSDSVTEMRLYGEGRLRYFFNQGEAAGLDADDHGERYRLRYRLRLGADIKLQEHWMLGVLLETNNSARSANVTLGENPFFAKGTVFKDNFNFLDSTTTGNVVTGFDAKTGKFVTGKSLTTVTGKKGSVVTNVNFGDALFVGRAFLKYDPFPWLTLEGGRMPNPFVTTRMVWDPDINPEGFVEQFRVTLGPWGSSTAGLSKDGKEVVAQNSAGITVDLFANFGQFIYDDVGFENSFNTGNGPFSEVPNRADRWMLGWQIGARANFTKNTYFQVAPTFYNYTGGGLTSAGPFNGDSPLVILNDEADPVLITFNQTGTNDLAVLDVPVEFGWKWGNLPFTVFGDFAYNLDADARADKAGHPGKHAGLAYQVGASVGSTKKKGDWELRGWWQHSEAYALDPNIIDDDIFDGRLNMEGIFLQGSYQLTNGASIIVQYSHGERIDDSLGTPGFGGLGTPPGFPLQSTDLLYVDLNLRF